MKLMKRCFWVLILIARTASAQSPVPLTVGHVDTLASGILGEKRPIWVYLPPRGPEEGFAPKKYPVVYLLDADWNFPTFTGLTHYLSTVMGGINGHALSPEMIVVGIPATFANRTRDLTPTSSLRRWDGRPDQTLRNSGGGDRFLDFIEAEVAPYVEAHYPTQPYRVVVGHSLGGLAALHALATRPRLFDAYVAIEPSTWWDGGLVLQQLQPALAQSALRSKKLYLALANGLPAGLDSARARQDTTGATVHFRANRALVDLLRRQSSQAPTWTWRYYVAEDHASVVPLAHHDALRWLFQYPAMAVPADVQDPAFSLTVVQRYYAGLSQQYGYVVPPPEELVNWYGWACANKQPAKARAFFQFNADTYPQSFNANLCLAGLLEEQGYPTQAIGYYERALVLHDDAELRQKLFTLRKATPSRRVRQLRYGR